MRILLLLLTCSIFLTSCMALIGIKKPKPVKEKIILQYSEKFNIPKADSYELDTSFISYLYFLDTTQYKKQIKNHHQPLQALYFDKSGQMVSFQVNCYAGGFPNLKWDRNKILTTFPPKQQAPIDSILPLAKQLKYLRPLSGTTSLTTTNYDFVVVVYWSRFMGRQSKRLIHLIQDNCKLSGGKQVKIIYANNDNVFSMD